MEFLDEMVKMSACSVRKDMIHPHVRILQALNKQTNFTPFSFAAQPFILRGGKCKGYCMCKLYKVLIEAHGPI